MRSPITVGVLKSKGVPSTASNSPVEHLEDYAEIAGIELLTIDNDTTISKLKFELKVNEVYYK
ncbi:hypothetical protein FACS189420_1550 [Bacteroidia bacterium]|nr:hypothetical protein FACS189420_1550 [Bacteroidia bacterium]